MVSAGLRHKPMSIKLQYAVAALHTDTTRVILSKAGGHAAQGLARRYHSVCNHPIGLPTLSGRRGVLDGATGLPQIVNHRAHRGK